MKAQSIKISAGNLIGNSVYSVNPKTKQQESNFGQIMTSSMNHNWDTWKTMFHDQTNAKDVRTDVKDFDKFTKTAANKASKTAMRHRRNSSISEKEAIQETANEAIDSMKNESDQEISEKEKKLKLLNQIMELLNSIQQAILKALNRNPEELQQLMKEQNMTIADLQNPDMLRQLVLADCGQTDVSALLMDENLAATMRRLLMDVEELTANSGLDFTDEQIKDILARLENAEINAFDSLSNTDAAVLKEITLEQSFTSDLDITHDTIIQSTDDEAKVAVDELEPSVSGHIEGSKDIKAANDDTEESMHSLSNDENSEIQYHSNDRQTEKKTVDDVLGFVNQMVEVTQRTQMDAGGNTVYVTQLREIANQIIEKIKVVLHQDQTSMELQLNPENLGKVNLSVQSKDGVMTAQFVVENELTKEAIESQIFALKNTLEQQGIKVENIEVTIANYSFEQSDHADTQKEQDQQGSSTRRKLTLDEAMQMNDLPQEDIKTVDITGMRGTQIDYTA